MNHALHYMQSGAPECLTHGGGSNPNYVQMGEYIYFQSICLSFGSNICLSYGSSSICSYTSGSGSARFVDGSDNMAKGH